MRINYDQLFNVIGRGSQLFFTSFNQAEYSGTMKKGDQKVSIKCNIHLEMLRNCGNSFPFCNETKTESQEICNLRTATLKAVRVFQIIQQEPDQDKQKRH